MATGARSTIVVALGGNALLERNRSADASLQLHNIRRAVEHIAPLAANHRVVITHGNGPQVGLLARESAADSTLTRPYPFDALGAETQGLIGYWLAQTWRNARSADDVIAVVTQTVVAQDDPAMHHPTKFIGPMLVDDTEVERAGELGWTVARDGPHWRRVVASPEPISVVEMDVVRSLVANGCVVICGGGGGVPVVSDPAGHLVGVEAVVDKDLTAALIAEAVGATVLLLLTDVDGVVYDIDDPNPVFIGATTPAHLRSLHFPAGSMGPKVDAACRFVERTGGTSVIGSLDDAVAMLDGRAGTVVSAAIPASRR